MNAQNSQWLEVNRAALSPLLSWNQQASQTTEKLARHGLALAQDMVELGARQLQLAAEVKDPQKWFLEESKLLNEYGRKMTTRAGDYLDLSKEVRESVSSWGENTAKTTAETIIPEVRESVLGGVDKVVKATAETIKATTDTIKAKAS